MVWCKLHFTESDLCLEKSLVKQTILQISAFQMSTQCVVLKLDLEVYYYIMFITKIVWASLWHPIYQGHEMTSIGLLLGVSSAKLGTMDMSITRLLSIHIPALLPPTSTELDVPHNVQVSVSVHTSSNNLTLQELYVLSMTSVCFTWGNRIEELSISSL